MENKMQRWEKQYDEYTNGEKKKRLEMLKSKLENKSITKEEYEEYKKMLRIEKNLPKVKNLQDFQKQLIQTKNEIIAELNRREGIEKSIKDVEKENQKLEKELEKINEQKQEIVKQLKNKNLSEKEKADLQNKLAEYNNKIQLNNAKFLENVEKQPKESDEKDKDITKLSKKELTDKAINLSIKIDVCNLYATRLMKGRENVEQIKSVEENIKWDKNDYRNKIKNEVKTFKLPKEQKEKMEQLKDASRKQQEKAKTENPKKEETSKAMVKVSEFDQKHPKIAAIKNWFKKGFEKFAKKEEVQMSDEDIKKLGKKIEQQVETKTEKQSETAKKQENAEKRRDTFLKDLKFVEDLEISEIAEKGLDEVKKENKTKKQIEAARKLLENKKNARGDVDAKSIERLEAKIKEAGEDR